jgi:hypothetical protein
VLALLALGNLKIKADLSTAGFSYIPQSGNAEPHTKPYLGLIAMSLHSSLGRGGDRRRRLLTEEYSASTSDIGSATVPRTTRVANPPVHKSEHYGDAEFLVALPRLIDLVPHRRISFVLILLGGLMVIAGLECLYAWMPELPFVGAGGRLAALDLAAPGSLASWFSSVILLAASVVAGLIYSIRRHKTDDYHGRYRIWLWAAGGWFWLATANAAGLHQAIQQMATAATGTKLLGDGSLWWIGAWLLLMVVIGSRVLLDMWASRLSSAAIILAWVCYATAFSAHLGWLLPDRGVNHVLARQGAQMAGDLLMLLAMGLYARHVLLDAQGLLRREEPKEKARTRKTLKVVTGDDDSACDEPDNKPETEQPEAKNQPAKSPSPQAAAQGSVRRVDPATTATPEPAKATQAAPKATAKPATAPAPEPKPAIAKASPAPVASAKPATSPPAKPSAPADPPSDEKELEEADGQEKLSKADRKALKKRLLEERLKREQRTAKW